MRAATRGRRLLLLLPALTRAAKELKVEIRYTKQSSLLLLFVIHFSPDRPPTNRVINHAALIAKVVHGVLAVLCLAIIDRLVLRHEFFVAVVTVKLSLHTLFP